MKTHTFFQIFFLLFSYTLCAQVKPSPDNTGAKGLLGVSSGSMTITEDGTIVRNLHIEGSLNIKANNVTIKNCIIDTEGIYGIRANYGFESLLIEDCEIRGMRSAAIIGDNFTALRCNIWNSGADGIKPGNNFLIEGCYFHKLGYIENAHADGVQMVAGGNGIIRGNTFDMPYDEPGYKNSQCIIISTNNDFIDTINIENNWIDGGGYSIQIRDKENGFGNPTNVSVFNNLFGRNHQFGTHVVDGEVTWSCNRWEDTNELIGTCDVLSTNDLLAKHTPWTLYSDPIAKKLYISLQELTGGYLTIYDLNGKELHASYLSKTLTGIDTNHWESGIYIVALKNKQSYDQSKFVVE